MVLRFFLAGEAVGEVVSRVDGGAHLATAGTEEAEVAFTPFVRRPVRAEGGDGDGHGQVVAQAAQEFRVDHVVLEEVTSDEWRVGRRSERGDWTKGVGCRFASIIDFVATNGSQSDQTAPPYDPRFDRNLDGFVTDGLLEFAKRFGLEWSF
jgi:hypothetical protein